MRNLGIVTGLAAVALVACGPTEQAAAPKPHVSYDAKAFFDTTAVSMASPTPLAFSPDGAKLATVGGESLLYRPGDVTLGDPKSGQQLGSFAGHPTCVWCVASRTARRRTGCKSG